MSAGAGEKAVKSFMYVPLIPSALLALLGFSFLSSALVGCDSESSATPPRYAAPGSAAVQLVEADACQLDGDCDPGLYCFRGVCATECEADGECTDGLSCDASGRCAPADGLGPAADETAPGTRIVNRPDPVIHVSRGQATVDVAFTIEGALPPGGLRWRIERSDRAGDPRRVFHAAGDGPIHVSVIAGAASPDAAEPQAVDVLVISTAGTLRFALAPARAEDGVYAGDVTMANFGQAGLPIEVQVVTDPPGSSIARATSAFLVLPVVPGHLFNPVPHAPGGPTSVTRPLVYDDFARAWVAQFDLPHPVGDGLFGWARDLPVTRSMRFELNPTEDGMVTGRMVDRWSGLRDRRSSTGVVTAEDVTFEGSFRLLRGGPAPLLARVVPPVEYEVVAPRLLPAPGLLACDALTLPDAWAALTACDGLADVSSWASADAATRAACAVEFSDAALAADPLSAALQGYLSGGTGSFVDFIEGCSDGSEAACATPEELLCARELSAYALHQAPQQSPAELLRAHSATTRAASLGTQLAAYYADSHTRAAWLSAQSYPSLLSGEVRAHVTSLLDDWRADVLDAHLSVLSRQLDVAGVTAFGLSVPADGGALDSARTALAVNMSQGLGAAIGSLDVLVRRWNDLYRDDEDRSAAAANARARLTDLYLSLGLVAALNDDAERGALNATLGSGFGGLMRQMHRLGLPFDGLLFERQGTVAVSTSLDPTAGNEGLLASLEMDARDEVASAQSFIGTLLADAREEALQRTLLGQRLENEQADVRLELATLCGVPMGCTLSTLGSDPACEVPVEAGRCGFWIDQVSGEVLDGNPEDLAPSEASAAVLEIRTAAGALGAAEEERRRHYDEVQRSYATTEFFEQQTASWQAARQGLALQIDARLAELATSQKAELAAAAALLQTSTAQRGEQLAMQAVNLAAWDELRAGTTTAYMGNIVQASSYRGRAGAAMIAGDTAVALATAFANGLPSSAYDYTSAQRYAALTAGWSTAAPLYAGAVLMKQQALALEQAAEEKRMLDQAEVRDLELRAELAMDRVEADIAEAQGLHDLAASQSAAEAQAARDVLDALERDRANAESYERDLFTLRERRDALLNLLSEGAGQDLAVQQAQRTLLQRFDGYARVVARAGLLSSQLETLESQAADVNQLVGSPEAFFTWANELSLAESRLTRAKGRVMDWLVALEYYAVRPFMAERLAVLLATNTTQLEQVASRLSDLQDDCGGAVNSSTVEISVRDLLGIDAPRVDNLTGEESTPAEVFRALLAEARIPIDRSVRYRADANVGDLLAGGDVLALPFRLGIDDFANLSTTCNAKVVSLGVQIVGEGLGDALPTVNVLYDGTSVLRSCQPDIEDIVAQVGRDVTPFGQLTEFRTPGRSVAPIAGVNDFRDREDDNATLGGLPLVSEYTLLIDMTTGENRQIDWSRLDDIRLRMTYSYQDLFPPGQCGTSSAP